MLAISDSSGFGRRHFLRVGGLGLGGLSLSDLFSLQATADQSNVLRNKSVVFLFMHGGPSQIETFDPKMSAPDGIRSATGELLTRIPGVTFGSTFPQLAQRAHQFSIVRSFATGDGNHDIKPIVGKSSAGANLGSIYARVAGSNDPVSGLPLNTALFPRSVDPKAMPRVSQFGKFDSTGALGGAFAPFIPGADGQVQQDMKLAIPLQRLDDRRQLLGNLDRLKRTQDRQNRLGGIDRIRNQAFDVLLGGVAEAFDLSRESSETIARYDTGPLVRPDQISRKWNNYKRYIDNGQTLGKLMLLARRLCEEGCRFVTVTTNFVWDMHSDVNNAGMIEGMSYMAPPFDHAVSMFLDDVEARGLSDQILLVCCGEMGRTPKMNNRGGRDHWGRLSPLLLAGGGLNKGHVIGQSTTDAGEPRTEPVTNDHLVSTIMHTLFDIAELRLVRGIPNEVMRVATSAKPIDGLL